MGACTSGRRVPIRESREFITAFLSVYAAIRENPVGEFSTII
jgi:hypothetical protein